jgi:hypothetical protein
MRLLPHLLASALLLAAFLPACGSSPPGTAANAACAPAPFPALGEGSTPEEKRAMTRIAAQIEQLGKDEAALCASGGGDAAKKAALDERRATLTAMIKELDAAATAGKRKRALDKLYRATVPSEQRPEEITFRFGVNAELPNGGEEIEVAPGTALPTGARVRFRVEVSQRAHLYIFQKTPSDEVTVLFPEPRIGTKNPLDPGVLLDIPPAGQRFKLNDKDLGTESIFLVVSRSPLPTLDAALARVKEGSVTKIGQNEVLRRLAAVTPGAAPAGCGTRALELDAPLQGGGAGDCHRSRGLVLDDPGERAEGKSRQMEVRTDAGDDMIVKVFPFQHVASGPQRVDAAGAESGRDAPRGASNPSAPPVPRGIVMED